MKIYPVAPFRLLIALVAPSAVLIICTFLLTSLTNAQATHPVNIISVEFTKQDQLIVDVGDDDFVSPGDIIQYTVSLSNTGDIALSNLHITDTIDPHTTLVGGSLVVSPLAFADDETAVLNTPLIIAAPGLLANDDLQGPGTTIASYNAATAQGGSVVVQPDGEFSYQPPANFVGSDSFSYTLANDAGSDTAVVQLAVLNSDLALSKWVNNPTPFEGGEIAYTVRITNEGDIPLTNIIISDTLPTGLTYNDHNAPVGSPYNPATGLWSIPSLSMGETRDLNINMTVDAGTAGQIITNTAVLHSLDQTDANPHNNSNSATLTVQPQVDIALSKTVDNKTPLADDTIIYTVTATNLGPNNATGVQVLDALPDGVTFVSSDQASYVPPVWTIGDLDTNQTATLKITAVVNNVTAGSIIKNTAAVTAVNEADSNSNNDSASATITIDEAITNVDIALNKTVNNSTPFAGDTIIYTVTAANLGPDEATGIQVMDTLPSGVTFVTSDQASFVPPIWTIDSLDANQVATLSITAIVNNDVTGGSIIKNTAAVTAVNENDSNPNNDSASATITIDEAVTAVDIALNKSVNNLTPIENDTIIYTITANNNGPNDATGVQVTDLLPIGVTHVSSTTSHGSYTAVNGIWNIGSLPQTQNAVLTITATVNTETAAQIITNIATLTAVNENDSNPDNDSASATITIDEAVAAVDIALNKSVNNPTPFANDTIVYTITASNNGPDNATGIQVTDLLPAGVTHSSSKANKGSYTTANGTWNIGSLNQAQDAVLTITATVNSETAVQTITNIATLTAVNESDTNPDNDSASATITIHETVTDVDIALSKTVDNSTPLAGDTIVYTITAANLGPDDATGVEVTDALPNGVTFVAADQASFVPPIWTIASLNANQTATLNITVSVNDAAAGSAYTNIAALTAVNESDTNPDNNSASANITIHKAPTAVDDDLGNNPAYQVSAGAALNQPNGTNDPVERNDDVGFPAAAIATFGGGTLGGSVTNHNAGSTVAPLPTFSDGSLTVYANGRFTFTPPTGFLGDFQFRYRLSNSAGTSDATVTIRVQEDTQEAPDAVDDPNGGLPGNSTPGSTPYHLHAGSSSNVITGLLNNDTLGTPAAALTHFGGGSLGGSVTSYTAGQTAANGGHSLRVNSDGSLTYTPPAAFTGLFTFQYRLTNTQGTDDATVTIAVGERPSCDNDNYTATGNIHISHNAGTGVLSNDSGDVEITAVQGGSVGTTQNSSQNGQITLQADGRFVYDPPPRFNGADAFSYTVNNGFDKPQTCTAIITVSDMVWFIDSSASGSNQGTLSNPFTSITAFNNANNGSPFSPTTGSLIYLFEGDGYDEADGINLRDNQRLIGQRINLATVINADAASLDLPPFGTAQTPLLQSTNGNAVDLAANNTIRGLDIGDTPAGFALEGTAVGSPTINSVSITGAGGALRIDGGDFGSNVSFNTLESTASPAQNMQLVNVTGSLNVSSGGNGLSGAADTAVAISGGTLNFNYPGSITQNANFPTIAITDGHSGSLTFGGSINATNGTGLQFDNADGSYTFNGTTTLNGGDAGIDILNGSDGTFTFNNTTITDPSGTSFWLQSSTADVTYSGSIDDADDTAVYINNNDNATLTFQSGSITSADGGMTIINSNNSTIAVKNSIEFDTASDDALVLRNNDDSIISFTGKITIDTTTGAAFLADGGGTVSATGNGSVLNTTNRGTAVQITDTIIGASNVTFQTVVTDKAENGILLTNTGTTGHLIVTDGGTIQNSTGDGISVQNGNISLNQMNILDSAGSGFFAKLDGADSMYVNLTNNTVNGSTIEGIFVDVGAGSTDNGRMDLNLDNNVVYAPDSAADGISIQSHSQTTLCADINSNQSSGSGGMADFHLGQHDTSAFFLQDFAADVTTTLVNKGNSKTGGGVVAINPVGEPFAGGMNCSSGATGLAEKNTAVFPQHNTQINHTINTLPAGKAVTLRFNIQINNPFPPGIEQISSQAFATAADMTPIFSDDPATAVPNDPTITSVATIKLVHLPLILNDVTTLPDWPDLIVESISTTNDDLTVVVKNIGTTSVTDEFWVDAYFNPNPPPTGVNQTIQTLGVAGVVWGVDHTALPIAPGETLTLTLNSPYYDAQNSHFNGTIPAGDIYVQVDSANTATSYGAVLETHEASGGAYNNIAPTSARRSVIIAVDNPYRRTSINNPMAKRP